MEVPGGGPSAASGHLPDHVVPEHVEDLRHAHQHRDPAPLDQPQDVVRVQAAGEDDGAVDHRRHVRGHRLPEHVAERQQVDEPQRQERPGVLPVLRHLALDRHDVGEHVAMADDDALGIGRRARGEDDLDDVVARDLHGRHRTACPERRRGVGAPVEIGELPDLRAAEIEIRREGRARRRRRARSARSTMARTRATNAGADR